VAGRKSDIGDVEVDKAMFVVYIVYMNSFSTFCAAKDATWRGRVSGVSRGRLALQKRFLPSGRSKMRLVRGRESVNFSAVAIIRKYILHSGRPKMGLWQGREGDVSSGRVTLISHFCLLLVPKRDLDEVEKEMFNGPPSTFNKFSA
jgi:hypothetical protein